MRDSIAVVGDAITLHDDLDDGGDGASKGCVYVDNVLVSDVQQLNGTDPNNNPTDASLASPFWFIF